MNRMARVKRLPCLACLNGVMRQPMPSEVHHLNLGGKAGQKRRGDRFTIPLCSWHHRGEPMEAWTVSSMTAIHGPSLARQSKKFRERYGADDDLLGITDRMLERKST